jgi:protein TonB
MIRVVGAEPRGARRGSSGSSGHGGPSAGGLGFAGLLGDRPDLAHPVRVMSLVAAALVHFALGGLAARLPARTAEAPPRVSEIELAPPPAPPPPPPPEEKAPEPPPEKAPDAPARSIEPQVARAGNVVTAKADAPSVSEEAVDFVTDPEGKSFGSGVVARGGTLDRASTPVPVTPRAGAPVVRGGSGPAAPGITAPENLSRAARLEEANPCAGFYPDGAMADAGQVTLALVVGPSGQVRSLSVVDETPAREGFGAAARACLGKKTLSPAVDKEGRPTTAALTVRVRFTR